MGKVPSNVCDIGLPGANMYGCQSCPKCGSKYRCVFVKKPDTIQCDDCGFDEEIAEPAPPEEPQGGGGG